MELLPNWYGDINQGTIEWLMMRLGKVTASKVYDATARQKNKKYYKARENYMKANLAEILTGKSQDSFSSHAMKWGIEHEPQARAAYEFITDTEVDQIAFADHPTIARAGASPDGLVGKPGLMEVKCPNTSTHLEYMMTRVIPDDYYAQMQWQIECLEREWCDFVSFDPRLPEHLKTLIIRVPRDEAYIKNLNVEVIKFNNELDEMVAKLAA